MYTDGRKKRWLIYVILYLLISYWLSSYSAVLRHEQGKVWLDVRGCLYLMNLCTGYDLFRAKTALKDRQSGVTRESVTVSRVWSLDSGQTICTGVCTTRYLVSNTELA